MIPVLDGMQYSVQVITLSEHSVISHVVQPGYSRFIKSPPKALSVVYSLLYALMSSLHTLPPVVIVSFHPG